MAVRTNRFYHDPNIGAAFSNLASAFAPPDSGDIANYATASATREKAARLAELFTYAKDPSLDQTQFDRMGVAAGNYAPTQSYHAVGVKDATDRRGQDITARTSILNNDADNARALQEREMIEAASTGRNTADNTRSAITALFGPLNQGQIRPDIPADVAGLVGLPALPQTAGAPKPLSETELKAEILKDLPQGEQRAAALQGVDVEKVLRPDGTVENVFRPDAAGRTPYINKGAEAALKDGVAVIDGRQVPVTRDPQERVWRLADGSPIPDQAQVFDLAKPTGTNAELGLPTTANMTTANGLDASLAATEDSLVRYEKLLQTNPGIVGLPGAIQGAAQDSIQVLSELGAAFGDKAPNAVVSFDEIKAGLAQVAPKYKPEIQQARFMASELAYAYAQAQNPQGEVSRQAFERALETLTGGALRNNASALAGVEAFRDLIKSKRIQVERLRSPGGNAPTPQPAAAPQAERWERDPNTGKLRKVQ